MRAFVEGSEAVDFTGADRGSVYEFVRRALVRLDYGQLGKSDKGLVRRYLAKVTGLSRAQLTRLIGQHRETGRIEDRRGGAPAHPFERRYTRAGIRLLAVVDAAMGQMSGPATRALMRRQYEMFGDGRFERLARLSNGHLYNLRRSVTCRRRRTVVGKTQATHNAMHQGDLDGAKACPRMSPSGGVYHINMVDDVTQFQFVGTVQAISERFLLPVLEGLIEAFPFVVQGIHADNGSEYVNHRVAALLNKLRIGEFTKSRPRHCNDNALAESKNASVVRKHLGHGHLPRRFAPVVNEFTQRALSPFLNYHRPCLFPTDTLDDKGRVTKRYRDRDVMTPQRPSSSPSTTPSASSNPASPSTSSTPSPTPSATSTPPTRSTTPATHCSAPSGAPGALRPDLPSHPRNPTARPCPGGGPPWGGPLPTAPTARLSYRRRLNLRVPDQSGLAQVLRALQHRPSIHSLPNSDYGSFYLLPSGSSSYWKRLTEGGRSGVDGSPVPARTGRRAHPPAPRAASARRRSRRIDHPCSTGRRTD